MMSLITRATIAACVALAGQAPPACAQTVAPSRHFAPATAAVDCKRLADNLIIASNATDQTTSKGWVNLSDGLISFTTKRVGCVIVTLSGAAVAPSDFMFVQALLDGTTACAPSNNLNDAIFTAEESSIQVAHSMTYLCANVPIGTLRILPGRRRHVLRPHAGGGAHLSLQRPARWRRVIAASTAVIFARNAGGPSTSTSSPSRMSSCTP
jgi:hypothetical protein